MEVFNDRIDVNNFEHISHFTHFSSVFIVDFEQMLAGRVQKFQENRKNNGDTN